MKNAYRTDGNVVYIKVATAKRLHGEYPEFLETQIDLANLDMLLHHGVQTWYAHPAKAPKGKFYVWGKEWVQIHPDLPLRKSVTRMLHRVLMGDPRNKSGKAIEIHHIDNDGLNNRRENMERKSHKGNLRAHWPERNWVAYDENLDRIAVFKKLVEIGEDIRSQF